MIDELHCRLQSILDFILCKEDEYMVFDNNKNLYVRGRKFKAHKVDRKLDFNNDKKWVLEGKNNGTKFYRKRRR